MCARNQNMKIIVWKLHNISFSTSANVSSFCGCSVPYQLSLHCRQLDRVGLSKTERYVFEEFRNDVIYTGVPHVASFRKGKLLSQKLNKRYASKTKEGL